MSAVLVPGHSPGSCSGQWSWGHVYAQSGIVAPLGEEAALFSTFGGVCGFWNEC